MTDKPAVTTDDGTSEVRKPIDIERFLAENPAIADAIRTLHIAEEQYRRSLQAFDTTRIVTSHSSTRLPA